MLTNAQGAGRGCFPLLVIHFSKNHSPTSYPSPKGRGSLWPLWTNPTTPHQRFNRNLGNLGCRTTHQPGLSCLKGMGSNHNRHCSLLHCPHVIDSGGNHIRQSTDCRLNGLSIQRTPWQAFAGLKSPIQNLFNNSCRAQIDLDELFLFVTGRAKGGGVKKTTINPLHYWANKCKPAISASGAWYSFFGGRVRVCVCEYAL